MTTRERQYCPLSMGSKIQLVCIEERCMAWQPPRDIPSVGYAGGVSPPMHFDGYCAMVRRWVEG